MKSPLWKRLSMYLPGIGGYIRRVAEYERFVRHGHYYSPCISLDELRALLVGNPGLRVELFTHMLEVLHPSALAAALPGTQGQRGAAMYLRRV